MIYLKVKISLILPINACHRCTSQFYININFFLETNSSTTSCPRLDCSAVPSFLNVNPHYQNERLTLNCSHSLSNLTITQIVHRSSEETHAAQHKTFWNHSTNMTYIETPTQIIYIWYSLPNKHIVKKSFPHFTEAQFNYEGDSIRITYSDTWQVLARSVCGDILNLSGTF
jgi:hypothetical protein